MKYKVWVSWEACGEVEVEAESPEAAIEYVENNLDDISLPLESEYVDGSFRCNDTLERLKFDN